MREERTIPLAEIPIGGKNGFLWNRLHGEREELCERLLKADTENGCKMLQTRLRRVDDALDRLMSGSYGHCSMCGRAIEQAKLEIDPAVALCRDCTNQKRRAAGFGEHEKEIDDVAFESLHPFDTILLRTHNSDYRIMLLDPKIGRALVEGGDYLVEPNEALLRGSAIPGSEFKCGSICAGSRLEMWVNERVLLTSTIKSVHVRQNGAAESVEEISTALH
ncbi:MAG TPA: TraR/DksA C4-type zinc finger protein [Pyrinomonadaceae bacterium]|nr:TraR/DksA C4-type zinc finger protein [Pyrinomonadaceae bacterium]